MPACDATQYCIVWPEHALKVPVIAGTTGAFCVMVMHLGALVKQLVCADTHNVPLVNAGPKFTVTLVPVPLTVASPVIVHR